jgi:hypothetical protein
VSKTAVIDRGVGQAPAQPFKRWLFAGLKVKGTQVHSCTFGSCVRVRSISRCPGVGFSRVSPAGRSRRFFFFDIPQRYKRFRAGMHVFRRSA